MLTSVSTAPHTSGGIPEALLAQVHLGSWAWDVTRGEVTWSAELFRIFGVDPAAGAIRWEDHHRLYTPESLHRLREAVEACLAHGEPYRLELEGRRQDTGASLHLEAHGAAARLCSGLTTHLYGVVLDRTREMQARTHLQRTETLLEAAGRMAKVGGWRLDLATKRIEWTDAVYEIHEVDRSFEPGLADGLSFYPEEVREWVASLVERAATMGEGWDVETPFLTAKGTRRWVRSIGWAERTADRITAVAGTFLDQTRQREEQHALRASEELFRGIFENAASPMARVDGQGHLIEVNAAFCSMLGYSSEELKGRHFREISHPDDIAQTMALVCQALQGEGSSFHQEKRYLCKDGSIRWGLLSATLLAMPDDRPPEFFAVIKDITPRREMEEELREARRLAEETAQAKANFLATMSHEIRTPLNGVIGFASLLAETPLDPNQQEFCRSIRSSGNMLLGIVNDILDFSKAEAGRMTLEESPFDPEVAVRSCLDILRPAAEEKGLRLGLTLATDLPAAVVGDLNRCRQIVTNLLSNAVKFTREGGVDVTLSARPAAPDSVELVVAVADTGLGMEPEQLETIFEPFKQAEASIARRFGGTGLGLAISERLARLMGGVISVQSRPGVGSCFTLTLPCRVAETPGREGPAAERPAAPKPEPRLAIGPRVLVVDDNELNRRLAVHMLRAIGCHPDVAENGREAVEAQRTHGYDVVLMDLQMPVMSGLDAARLIREGSGDAVRPWIAAVTAHAMAGDRARCVAAGMNDYLSKPLRLAELQQMMARAAGVVRATARS